MDDGWRKAGITCYTALLKDNRYWKDGKSISRDQAIVVAANYAASLGNPIIQPA